MHVWFLSHNFPPEVNALATRTYEHARYWVRGGRSLDVITDIPHFPEGRVYSRFRNRFIHEQVDGISVYRVPIYPAENRRRLRRTASYLSYMASAVACSAAIRRKPDIVVASSPHIFTAFAGYAISKLLRVPFVMEVRDLWPQSIGAVGAIEKPWILRGIERAVMEMYRAAERIVVLTESFRTEIVSQGVPETKLRLLPNGIDPEFFARTLDPVRRQALRSELGLEGKFVVAYLGTLGMAHKVEVLLEAARRCRDREIAFLVVGCGAERRKLESLAAEADLDNFLLLPKQPRDEMLYYLDLADACVVHLRDQPVFATVLPSKLFEAMGARKPVILGVRGESARLLTEAGAGLCVPPEDPDAIVTAAQTLKNSPRTASQMAGSGYEWVRRFHDRSRLAANYWSILTECMMTSPVLAGRPVVKASTEQGALPLVMTPGRQDR